MRVIHVAGTKGKGSTSAFASSILAQYLSSTTQPRAPLHKIGLYTSPHLRFVRERIQINNEPLSEESFAKYFFEVWDRLEDAAKSKGLPVDAAAKPVYFRFLTLMAFHTYMSEGVDTAVIECGIGGEHDSTNIITAPTVTGITSLGIDHVAMLGNTIEEIAWHKAGIMKTGALAFTSPQPASALQVLEDRAAEKSVALSVVANNPLLSAVKLGLAADFQMVNASLAVAVAFAHLEAIGHSMTRTRDLGFEEVASQYENHMHTNIFSPEQHKDLKNNLQEKDLHVQSVHTTMNQTPLPPEFVRGLENVRWPGRCETRKEANITWHIDGGHTLESIEAAAKWYASQTPRAGPNESRILIFNQQTRDANALAHALHRTLAAALHTNSPFTHAIFCTNVTFLDAGYSPDLVSVNTDALEVKQLDVQKRLAGTWQTIDAKAEVKVVGTIEEAVERVRAIARQENGFTTHDKHEAKVLVTGSLHLVGGFLDVLERER